MNPISHSLTKLQKASVSIMGVLVLITFIATNMQAVLWQSSGWLVGTVLPAVVVDLTNDERTQLAETPLVRNSVLDAAAKLKAEDMAKHQYFAHFSPTGVSPWHWFDEAGYVYAYAGENLAIHFTDSEEVVRAWMNSPAHRENIVNDHYTEIGVGTAKGQYEGYDTVYVVQLFGTPAVPPPRVAATTPPVAEELVVTNVAPAPDPAAASDPTPVSAVLAGAAEPDTNTLPVDTTETENEAVVLSNEEGDASEQALLETVESPVPTDELSDVLVLESPSIATSSGLMVASITGQAPVEYAGITLSGYATQPNSVLQILYMVLGGVVIMLLVLSIILETRRFHYVQVTYGVLLLCGMGTLWYVHSLLTVGAVVA